MGRRRNGKGWICRAGQSFLCFCLLFLCLPCNGATVHTVNLVLSSEAVPYREAAEALQGALSAQGVATQMFTLETMIQQEPSLSLEQKVEVWVAIGSRAADYLNFSLPDSVSLVYCMVADPEKIGLKNGRKNNRCFCYYLSEGTVFHNSSGHAGPALHGYALPHIFTQKCKDSG